MAAGRGADLTSEMDRLGHAQIQTTQRYLHTSPMPTKNEIAEPVRHLGEQPLGLLLGQDADRSWRDLMQLGVGVHRFSC
jgi:hypothetical protein